MQSDIDRIKERLSILDVVGHYVELTKSGGSYKGLSPFVSEKTPSFFVSPDKGLYHCFSTGKGGDMFTFIQEVEGVDFRDALKLLADRAGVTLTESKGEKSKDDEIRKALGEALALFEEEFGKNEEARVYVEKRGINEKTRESFRIGYAPNSFDFITKKLAHVPKDILVLAGLVRKKENGRIYDYFRDRVMFPIFDAQGRITGFSGRGLGKDAVPKYLNSSDSPVYDKSLILYGLDKAKQSIRSLDCVILVEGQVDLVLSHQMGYQNTVAVSGTGLTERHLESLKHLTTNLIFAFDGDKAGINSALRAASKAIPLGFSVKMPVWNTTDDPADIISRDPKEWKDVIKSSRRIPVSLALSIERISGNRERFLKALSASIIPLIRLIPSEIERDEIVRELSREIDVSFESLRVEVKKGILTNSREGDHVNSPKVVILDPRENRLLTLLALSEWVQDKDETIRQFEGEINDVAKRLLEKDSTLDLKPKTQEMLFWLDARFNDPDKRDNALLFIQETLIRSQIDRVDSERELLKSSMKSSSNDREKTVISLLNLDKERQALLDKLRSLM